MYKDKTSGELLELLRSHKMLTFQSQLDLREELKRRNELKNIGGLNQSIDDKILEVKEMKYLKELGFKLEKFESSIKVTRSGKAIFVDVIAILLGIVFCVIALWGVVFLINSFFGENELDLSDWIINIIRISLGIIGVKFLNGFKRFFDYLGFELSRTGDLVTLKKRFDLKLVEITNKSSTIDLDKQPERYIMTLAGDEILSANAKNLVQRMTIMELQNLFKVNSI